MDLEELLGCTGIVKPSDVSYEKPKQTRPKKTIKLPMDGFPHYVNEDQDTAKKRYIREGEGSHNWQQKKVSRTDSWVSMEDGVPYLFVVLPQLKASYRKANAAEKLLGKKEVYTGLKGKIPDKLFVGILARDLDGDNMWFNKKRQVVLRIPINEHYYAAIPLYETKD